MKNISRGYCPIDPNISIAQDSFGNFKELFKIEEIKIVGAKKVEPEAISEKLTLKKGTIADNCTLRSDIKTIYEMKYFESVEAHQETIKGKKILVIRVMEKPIISVIRFEGNDEVSADDLKEQLKTKEYNILDVNTIKGDVVLLQKYYEEKGYFLANVDYELVKNEVGGLDLVLKLKSFIKYELRK